MKPQDLKNFRKQHNLTQKECGDLLGLAMRTIQCYEGGQRPIPQIVENFTNLLNKTNKEKMDKERHFMVESMAEARTEQSKNRYATAVIGSRRAFNDYITMEREDVKYFKHFQGICTLVSGEVLFNINTIDRAHGVRINKYIRLWDAHKLPHILKIQEIVDMKCEFAKRDL